MYYKTVLIALLVPTLISSFHLPEVYEDDTSEDFRPSNFNFQEYKKSGQQDLQKMRYQLQQTSDNKSPMHEKQSRAIDQHTAGTQEMPVKVPPAQSSWKVVHPKFVNERPQEQMTTIAPLKKAEEKQNAVERQRVIKKSLKPNSYQVTEDEQPNDRIERQDIDLGNQNYLFPSEIDLGAKQPKILQQNLGGFVGHHQDNQFQALNSLIGQKPNAQLQGLQNILNSNKPLFQHKDHTPIKEEGGDNPPPQTRDQVPDHMLQAIQAISKNGVAGDRTTLKALQAQLDASATAHAEHLIAQAQQNALEQVKAQHAAIAKAQADAENAALAQIQAQNDALARAHAANEARLRADARRKTEIEAAAKRLVQQKENERESSTNEERERYNNRKAQERRRQEELARERARVAALQAKLQREREQNKQQETHKNKKLTHANQDISETQNHYFTHQAPQHIVQEPQVKKQSYTYDNKGENADVTKYYVPPQITSYEGKNAHGEHEVQYAAKYAFGYRIRDYHVGNDYGHEESRDGQTAKGRYHVLLPDGRVQSVEYFVDPSGYHATVSYDGAAQEHS